VELGVEMVQEDPEECLNVDACHTHGPLQLAVGSKMAYWQYAVKHTRIQKVALGK
jgi:hypothetical protein